jgi:hypothetical protein
MGIILKPETRYPTPVTRYPIPDTRNPKPDTRNQNFAETIISTNQLNDKGLIAFNILNDKK